MNLARARRSARDLLASIYGLSAVLGHGDRQKTCRPSTSSRSDTGIVGWYIQRHILLSKVDLEKINKPRDPEIGVFQERRCKMRHHSAVNHGYRVLDQQLQLQCGCVLNPPRSWHQLRSGIS